MKNLNPYCGLNQIRKGYLCLPRQIILDSVRDKVLKVNELSYFLIFLLSADWDSDPHRKGFIRHDLKKLSGVWKIPYQTLTDNLTKLIYKKIITKERSTPKIPDFDRFTFSRANQTVRQTYTNEELEQYFDNLFPNSEIPLQPKRKSLPLFNSSSKVEFSNVLEEQREFTDSDKVWLNLSRLENDVLEVFFKNDFDLYQRSSCVGSKGEQCGLEF